MIKSGFFGIIPGPLIFDVALEGKELIMPEFEADTARLKEARRLAEGADMRLACSDQIGLAETIKDPPEPNERLVRAAKLHAQMIQRR